MSRLVGIVLLLSTISPNSYTETPEEAYLHAKNDIARLYPSGEQKISTSAEYSYLYARDVVGGAFLLGEPVIATSAKYSYTYASEVLNEPFILGEEAISKSRHYSILYVYKFGVDEWNPCCKKQPPVLILIK